MTMAFLVAVTIGVSLLATSEARATALVAAFLFGAGIKELALARKWTEIVDPSDSGRGDLIAAAVLMFLALLVRK